MSGYSPACLNNNFGADLFPIYLHPHTCVGHGVTWLAWAISCLRLILGLFRVSKSTVVSCKFYGAKFYSAVYNVLWNTETSFHKKKHARSEDIFLRLPLALLQTDSIFGVERGSCDIFLSIFFVECLREVHSSLQNDFSTVCELVLPLSFASIL